MMNKPRRRRRRKTNSAATVVRTIKKPNSQQPPIMHGWLIPPSQRPGIQFRRTLQAGALSSSSSLHPTPFGMNRKLNYSNVSAVLVYKEEGLLALNRAKQQLKVLPAKTKHLIWWRRKERWMNLWRDTKGLKCSRVVFMIVILHQSVNHAQISVDPSARLMPEKIELWGSGISLNVKCTQIDTL